MIDSAVSDEKCSEAGLARRAAHDVAMKTRGGGLGGRKSPGSTRSLN
jgi:hypothetical protein